MIENCRNEPAGTYPSLSDGSRCLVLRLAQAVAREVTV